MLQASITRTNRCQPIEVWRSVLEPRLIGTSCTLVSPDVVCMHTEATYSHKEKQTGIDPVTGRIPLGRFVSLVDPDADDLSRGAHGDVQRNGQADGSCGVQVGRQPTQERRNTGERTTCCNDKTSIARLNMVSNCLRS